MFILILVIGMNNKTKIFLVSFTTSFCSLLIFITFGFFYLYNGNKTVENKTEEVPYSQVPENVGVVLETLQSKILLYMDFEQNISSVLYLENREYGDEIYGYTINYTLKLSYDVIEEIIDTLGGIDLQLEEETYNYTGAQVVELVFRTANIGQLKREITEKIIEKIGDKGITLEELIYIVENSETDISVPDCYFWPDHIREVFKSVRFINP